MTAPRNTLQGVLNAAASFSVKSIADDLEISPAAIYAWKAGRRTPNLLNVMNLNRVLILRSRKMAEAMHNLNEDLRSRVEKLSAELEVEE